jgi:hypothetical protein
MTNETPDRLSGDMIMALEDRAGWASKYVRVKPEVLRALINEVRLARRSAIDQARPLPEGQPVAGNGGLSEKELALMNALGGYQQVFDAIGQAVTRQESGLGISVMAFMRKVRDVPLAAPPIAGDAVREAVEAAYIAGAVDGLNRKPWEDSDDFFALQARDYVNTRAALNPIAPATVKDSLTVQAQPAPVVDRERLVKLISEDSAYQAEVMDEQQVWLAGILADEIIRIIQGKT